MDEEIEELDFTSEIETLTETANEEKSPMPVEELLEVENPEIPKTTIEPSNQNVTPQESSLLSSKTSTGNSNNNYLSYEKRLMTRVSIALIMFALACIFLGKALKTDEVKVTYNENSNVSYRVCLGKNQYYKEECVEPDMEYLSTITKNIPITFVYQANYSSIINYKYNYYVTSSLKIYNPDSEDKVLYKESSQLTKKKTLENSSNTIAFSENVNVNFEKYNNYVNEYKSKYSLNTDSTLEVSLYLEDENKVAKKVSGVVIPLSSQTFSIAKNEVSNSNISATSVEKSWKNKNIIFAIISLVFSVLGIAMLVRIISLILKSTKKKSIYEIRLNQILKEYDRIIVRMKDKENFTYEGKQEIKVYDFLELLDARDTLERPIIYIKVNNIKSEFYVEDISRVYKYVMKESDFEEKKDKSKPRKE